MPPAKPFLKQPHTTGPYDARSKLHKNPVYYESLLIALAQYMPDLIFCYN